MNFFNRCTELKKIVPDIQHSLERLRIANADFNNIIDQLFDVTSITIETITYVYYREEIGPVKKNGKNCCDKTEEGETPLEGKKNVE